MCDVAEEQNAAVTEDLALCSYSFSVTVDRATIEVLLSGVSFPPRQSLVAQADFQFILQPVTFLSFFSS